MNENFKEVFKTIISENKLFEGYGLKFDDNIEEVYSKLINTSYKYCFMGNNRKLIIFLNPYYMNRTVVGIEIKNLTNGSMITLEDFLNKYYGVKQSDCFSWNNKEGEFAQKVEEMLLCLKELLKNEKLRQIINGETWDDIPFGWFGQR